MRKILCFSILLLCVFAQDSPIKDNHALVRYTPDCAGTSTELLANNISLAWVYDTDETIKSTALINTGKVYISTLKGKLLCLDLSTSKKLWEFNGDGVPFSASPSIIEGILYIGNEDGECIAIDITTGKEIWRFATDDKIVAAVNYYQGTIIFGSYDNHLYCLDKDGKLLWKLETEAPINGMCTIIESTGIIAGCDGFIRFINLEQGKEIASFDGKSYFASTPTVHNGKIFVGSLNGDYYAISFPEAKLLWQIEKDKQKGECYGSACATKDVVVFVSKKRSAFALNPESGAEIWSFTTQSRIDTSPTIVGDAVLFNEFSGIVHMLDLKTGISKWKYETGSRISSSPIVAEGYLIVTCEDGSVHAFK